MQQLNKIQKFSWLTPWLKRLSIKCIVFSLLLSNFSCESPKQNLLIDKEDREVVDDFLRYVAISELGIYTILGSKPVTGFYIPKIQPEDERRSLYEVMPKEYRKKVPFEKFGINTEVEELCNKWIKIQEKYIGEHFTICFDEKMQLGFLVNIPLVIYTIRKNYTDFSKVLGDDFDPGIVSKEIGNSSSRSWNLIKNDSYLLGLLFGFGEKNSKFFQWEKEKNISFPFRMASYNLPWFKKRPIPRREKIKDLALPQFIVYQPTDEIVEKYLREKKRILQIYQGKDFAETTISYLKGEADLQLSKRRKSVTIQKVDGKFVVK